MLESMQTPRRPPARIVSGPFLPSIVFAVILPFLLIALFDRLNVVFPAPEYLAIHNIIELFSVVVSFSIFGLGWFALEPRADRGIFIVSYAFLLVGSFDLLHLLSFPGMPDFLSPSSTNKGILFWEAARISAGLGLLIAAIVGRDRVERNPPRLPMAILGLALVALVTLITLLFEGGLPAMFVEGRGLTPAKIGLEWLDMALFGLALVGFWRRPLGEKDGGARAMIAALILSIASEAAFTLYRSAYDSYNLLGHVFKLAAYFLFYRGIFLVSVSAPYSRLCGSEDELRAENELRIKSESVLAMTVRELAVIHECTKAIARADDEKALLRTICEILCASGGYLMAWVGYADDDEAKSVRPMAFAGKEEGYLEIIRISWGEGPYGQGPTGRCIATTSCRYVQDFSTDPSVSLWRDQALPRGYRSSIGLPLKGADEKAFGALTLYSPQPDAFLPTEIELLEELAEDLAFGILSLRARIRNRKDEERILETLREKEILLMELHHRTRNNMQVISSMLSIEEERLASGADKKIFEAVGMRIQAMALVHQKLYQSGDLSRIELRDYIEGLCLLVRESEGRDEGQVSFDFDGMEEVKVLIDTAIPLGIVLNELLANAFAHAFPGGRRGRIAITLNRDDEGQIRLEFDDDGIGFDVGENPRERGKTGFMLIFNLVTKQLGGQIDCFSKDGTSWSMRFHENRYTPRV